MPKGMAMLIFGGVLLLLGLFTMPMKRANPRSNLIDNPIGWGLFGFGLSSLLTGIGSTMRERQQKEDVDRIFGAIDYPAKEKKPEHPQQESGGH